MQSFLDFARQYRELLSTASNIPLGIWRYSVASAFVTDPALPTVAIFSPHPDDEILAGGPLALRFRKEGCRVINIAMTLGREHQRTRRRFELEGACKHIGFNLVMLTEKECASVGALLTESPEWVSRVDSVSRILKDYAPRIIIVHHTDDWHPDHEGTALVVRAAVAATRWSGSIFEAEYWHEMKTPNLLLEIDQYDLAHMLEALSFHKGELERNPYHLRWPALLSNNVRRSEIVLGRGTKAPAFDFAALYRRNLCTEGTIQPAPPAAPVADKETRLLDSFVY